jgi:hypothetical protein
MEQQVWSIQLARQSTLRPRVAATTKCGGMWPLPVARSEMVDMGVSALHGERYIRFFWNVLVFMMGVLGSPKLYIGKTRNQLS